MTHVGTDEYAVNMVGDSGSGGRAGLVPAPAAGDAAAGKYLKADGTFAVPPGSGSYTDEQAQDAVGGILVDGTTIDFTYADGTPSITAEVKDGTVTNAKLANMAAHTFKARNTNSTGAPEDATATQATALLDAMVGDSGSGGTKGLVPAPASGDAAAGKFLKADGTYAVPAGSSTGDVVGPSSSVASEAALFDGTSGKLIKRATGTGIVYRTSGVDSTGALTGDVTTSTLAATIANDAVTNAKAANMATATFKGRTTAGTGDPEDLSVTQATALLNAVVGDSGSGGTKGLAPAPGAGDAAAGKFLKADGTYAVPAGTSTGDVVGPSVSVASEAVLFDGTTGKLVKRATGTGIVLRTSGVDAPGNLSGDVTTAGTLATTLANTAATAGTFGSSTKSPVLTVDAKGRVTASSEVTITGVPGGGLGAVLYDSGYLAIDTATIDTGSNGIAAGYTILEVFLFGRTDEVATFSNVNVTINGDTAANYDRQILSGVNTTAGAGVVTAASNMQFNLTGSSDTAGVAGSGHMTIPFYASTTFRKTIELVNIVVDNTAGNRAAQLYGWQWRNTAAINQLTVVTNTAGKKLLAGSRMIIYGR